MTARATWIPALAGPIEVAPLPMRVQFAQLLDAVCAEHLVSHEEMLGRRRTRDICAARRDLILRARAAGMSSTYIGQALGRDHTTILDYAGRVRRGA